MSPVAFTREQSRRVDRIAVEEFGFSGLVLMENAGRGVADVLCRLGIAGPVVVCCGKGNNAGDGFVIARHLDLRGHRVRVLLWAKPEELIGEAAVNFQILTKTDVPIACFGDEFDAPAGDYVEMVFADTGPDVDHDTEGRSIGPDFVRMARVLRNHGGYARIEARAGVGTTVFLYFRRAVRESDPMGSGAGTAERPAGSILVVDDEEAILELCHLILTDAGYEVLVAHDGGEALAQFERQRSEIGLVLTDLVMPDMNGMTLIWTLRRSKPGLRVMVTTGQITGDNFRELEHMGVKQVLWKPFTLRRLMDAVAQTLAEPVQCEPELFLVE